MKKKVQVKKAVKKKLVKVWVVGDYVHESHCWGIVKICTTEYEALRQLRGYHGRFMFSIKLNTIMPNEVIPDSNFLTSERLRELEEHAVKND